MTGDPARPGSVRHRAVTGLPWSVRSPDATWVAPPDRRADTAARRRRKRLTPAADNIHPGRARCRDDLSAPRRRGRRRRRCPGQKITAPGQPRSGSSRSVDSCLQRPPPAQLMPTRSRCDQIKIKGYFTIQLIGKVGVTAQFATCRAARLLLTPARPAETCRLARRPAGRPPSSPCRRQVYSRPACLSRPYGALMPLQRRNVGTCHRPRRYERRGAPHVTDRRQIGVTSQSPPPGALRTSRGSPAADRTMGRPFSPAWCPRRSPPVATGHHRSPPVATVVAGER